MYAVSADMATEMATQVRTVDYRGLIEIVEEHASKWIAFENRDTVKFAPWHDPNSDHLPVPFEDDSRGVRIMTWNCLNKSYVKWMQPDMVDGVDMSQRLSNQPFASQVASDQRRREGEVAARVVTYALSESRVVCLQEVSSKVMELIHKEVDTWNKRELDAGLVSEPRLKIAIFATLAPNTAIPKEVKDDNWTIVVWNPESYEIEGQPSLLSGSGIKDESMYFNLRVKDTGFIFRIVNVHIGFQRNEFYCAEFIRLFEHTPTPTIICGDFNCSARSFGPIHGDRVRTYEHSMFRFVAPRLPVVSHIQRLGNMGGMGLIADTVDHIILLHWPA